MQTHNKTNPSTCLDADNGFIFGFPFPGTLFHSMRIARIKNKQLKNITWLSPTSYSLLLKIGSCDELGDHLASSHGFRLRHLVPASLDRDELKLAPTVRLVLGGVAPNISILYHPRVPNLLLSIVHPASPELSISVRNASIKVTVVNENLKR